MLSNYYRKKECTVLIASESCKVLKVDQLILTVSSPKPWFRCCVEKCTKVELIARVHSRRFLRWAMMMVRWFSLVNILTESFAPFWIIWKIAVKQWFQIHAVSWTHPILREIIRFWFSSILINIAHIFKDLEKELGPKLFLAWF